MWGGVVLYALSLVAIKFVKSQYSFTYVFDANSNTNFLKTINNIIKSYSDFFKYYFTDEIINNSYLHRNMLNAIVLLLILVGTVLIIKNKKVSINKIIILCLTYISIPFVIFLADVVFTNKSILNDTGNLIMPCNTYIYIFLIMIFEKCIDIYNKKSYIFINKFIISIICIILFFACSVFQDCMVNNVTYAKNVIDTIYNDVKRKYDIEDCKLCVIGKLDYGIESHYKIAKGTIATYGIAWKTNLFHPCIYRFAKFVNNIDLNFVDYNTELEMKKNIEVMNMPSYPKNGYINKIDDIIIIKLNKD